MYASFNRFEIKMTLYQAKSVSHSGRCDDDVEELLKDIKYRRQFNKIPPELIAEELEEYGAWDKEQLKNENDNLQRITWIAGANIVEELHENRR